MLISIPPTLSNPENIHFIPCSLENFTLKWVPNSSPSQTPSLQNVFWDISPGRLNSPCGHKCYFASRRAQFTGKLLLRLHLLWQLPRFSLLHSLSGHTSRPSCCCSSSSFFSQREKKDGLLGPRDLITEQNPASCNTVSVMDLGFHDSLCKKTTKQRAPWKGKEGRWCFLLPSAPCCLPFPIFSILLRNLLRHILPPQPPSFLLCVQ